MNPKKNFIQANSPEEDFDRLLQNIEQQGKVLALRGREITASGQFLVDITQALRTVSEPVRSNKFETLLPGLTRLNHQADEAISNIKHVQPISINSTGGTILYDAYEAYRFTENTIAIEANMPSNDFTARFSLLDHVVGKYADEDEVKILIKAFRLDTPPSGKKSVLHLFESALEAYKSPVTQNNPVITSLIPMREAIELAVAELLKKRPHQEPAKNDYEKILSIGKQLQKDDIDIETIQAWANQWKELKDKLSAAKNQEMDRSEWGRILNLATIFLKSFFLGLEPEKIK
jgi:hypothetical protein